jgi:hypothetical protein
MVPHIKLQGGRIVVVWRVLTILARTDEIVRPTKSARGSAKIPPLLSWQRGFSTRKTTTILPTGGETSSTSRF